MSISALSGWPRGDRTFSGPKPAACAASDAASQSAAAKKAKLIFPTHSPAFVGLLGWTNYLNIMALRLQIAKTH
jgi:hypothetical protein